jgi:hypothetical protein
MSFLSSIPGFQMIDFDLFGGSSSGNDNGGILGTVNSLINTSGQVAGGIINTASKMTDGVTSFLSGDFLIYIIIGGSIILLIMLLK